MQLQHIELVFQYCLCLFWIVHVNFIEGCNVLYNTLTDEIVFQNAVIHYVVLVFTYIYAVIY